MNGKFMRTSERGMTSFHVTTIDRVRDKGEEAVIVIGFKNTQVVNNCTKYLLTCLII